MMKIILLCALMICTLVYSYPQTALTQMDLPIKAIRIRRDIRPVCIKPTYVWEKVDHTSCFRHCLIWQKKKGGKCKGTICSCY